MVVLNANLHDATVRAAETRLSEIGDAFDRGGRGREFNFADDEVVQVIERGKVIAASEDAEGLSLPIADEPQRMVIDDEPMLVVSDDFGDNGTVVIAVSTEANAEVAASVVPLLGLAVPITVALIALITWIVVSRAFRPVEEIRAEVDQISGHHLDRRVPVPPSGDEITALAVTMNGMLDRMEAAAHAQRQFVSDASHELRSPIATIRQHAEFSRAHPELNSVADLANVVLGEGLRLQGLVDSLLMLARLDESTTLAHEPVDLDDIALAEASRLRRTGATVDAREIHPARVTGDPRLLGQLVRNLADNALRHSNGQLAIGLWHRSNCAILTVEDDGAGVPEVERERVFERFVRLDEGRARDAGGAGLGLAIVRGVVEAAGGTVHVDESRWGGARFTVILPA